MRKQIFSMALLVIAIVSMSYGQNKQIDLLQGVWHFTDVTAPKPHITTLTDETENGDTILIDVQKEYEKTGSMNFFLTFKDHRLTQKTFGLKLVSTIEIKDNFIYLGTSEKPFFKIKKLNKTMLVVERVDSGEKTRYSRLAADSPLLELSY